MPELSENDYVSTSTGQIAKVRKDRGNTCDIRNDSGKIIPAVKKDELAKLNAPIRVRVDEPEEVDFLVGLAETNGFEFSDDGIVDKARPLEVLVSPVYKNVVKFRKDGQCISNKHHDLTFESDYQHIKAWLTHHGESDYDECERCGGEGYIVSEDTPYCPSETRNCPNCTDDTEPRPEDEEWRSEVQERLYADEFQYVDLGLEYGLTQVVDELCAYIDDLEQQISDCWENQQEYKNDVAELQGKVAFWKGECSNRESIIEELQNERAELEERIEEARERCLTYREVHKDDGLPTEILEILTPDSDEVSDDRS